MKILTCSFKKYHPKYGTGISIMPSIKWKGLTFYDLYPVPLVSQHKFREKYIKKINGMSPDDTREKVFAISDKPVLISNIKSQRDELISWMGAKEIE